MLKNAMKNFQEKNRKSVKQSEIITYQSKTFRNLNIDYIKSVITEHPKTSHKLSKIIGQAKKVVSNISLYSNTKKRENVLNKENVKITKREHAFRGYASTYNIEILNSFKNELQLKDIESATKSTLVKLLSLLRGINFVTTSAFVFKKTERKDKKNMTIYSSSKEEIIASESDTGNVFKSIYTKILAKTKHF